MTENIATDPQHADFLTHMLGAGPHIPKSRRGYRNAFCADVGGKDEAILLDMLAAGLVTAGYTINNGTSRYYHATRAGCEAIGLSKAAIKRAFED